MTTILSAVLTVLLIIGLGAYVVALGVALFVGIAAMDLF